MREILHIQGVQCGNQIRAKLNTVNWAWWWKENTVARLCGWLKLELQLGCDDGSGGVVEWSLRWFAGERWAWARWWTAVGTAEAQGRCLGAVIEEPQWWSGWCSWQSSVEISAAMVDGGAGKIEEEPWRWNWKFGNFAVSSGGSLNGNKTAANYNFVDIAMAAFA